MSRLTTTTDAELIGLIRNGDRAAEQALFQRFNLIQRVTMMIRSRTQARTEDQQDMISEVLVSVVVNLRRGMFDPQKGTLGSYIWGIARNKIRDFLKPNPDRNLRMPFPGDFPYQDESKLEKEERRVMLLEMVKQLDPKYRKAIILRYYEFLSIEDIADQLSLSTTQVYNRIHYALALIRERMVKK